MRKPRARVAHFRHGGEELAVIAIALDDPPLFLDLTPAERAVARLIVEGRSDAEIAKARGVSKRTIANQIASILDKTGSRSRVEFVARAFAP
jgi:DNA-binding CsgD family transcriptional regulator